RVGRRGRGVHRHGRRPGEARAARLERARGRRGRGRGARGARAGRARRLALDGRRARPGRGSPGRSRGHGRGRPRRRGRDTARLRRRARPRRASVVERGGGGFTEESERALVGMSPGETKEISFELADGSTQSLTATVKEIKEKVLPPLDDDLARSASEFETFAELRADVES